MGIRIELTPYFRIFDTTTYRSPVLEHHTMSHWATRWSACSPRPSTALTRLSPPQCVGRQSLSVPHYVARQSLSPRVTLKSPRTLNMRRVAKCGNDTHCLDEDIAPTSFMSGMPCLGGNCSTKFVQDLPRNGTYEKLLVASKNRVPKVSYEYVVNVTDGIPSATINMVYSFTSLVD